MTSHVDLRAFRVLSLCSGVGGLDLGLKLAEPTARTVAYVEIEAFACEILATRIQEQPLDEAPIWTNLKTFDGKPWRGKVDCVTGGYPCQPFSAAGKKLGDKDPRHLWPHVKRIVEEIEPPICFFENVGGHLRLGFEQVHNDLQSMGYRVKAGLFTAEEVGAPHKRERLFILAYPESAGTGQHISGIRQGVARNSSGLENLGDTNDKGLEGGSSRICECSDQLSTWPPSPSDYEKWEQAPAHLKPAIHRMADGLANRVDRVRACGNGVVPLVAAYAWRALGSGMHLTKS